MATVLPQGSVEAVEGGDDALGDGGEEEEEEPDMWQESYGGHHDSKPNGPTAVAVDFTFAGTDHVYGLPQHADTFSLKDTTATDPYRYCTLHPAPGTRHPAPGTRHPAPCTLYLQLLGSTTWMYSSTSCGTPWLSTPPSR